jgi:hypothetical protein
MVGTMPQRRVRRTRFLFGFILGLGIGAITLMVIGPLIPSQISSVTAQNFFFAATGVNSTMLVAIAVTIPSILSRTAEMTRRPRMLFLSGQLMIIFIGLLVSGVGILVFDPSLPLNYEEFHNFVNIIFTTWVISFVLLVSGIWVSALPEPESKG